MRAYSMTLHHILYALPVVTGRALMAGAIATDPLLDVTMQEGYLKQEVARRVELKLRELEA